MQKVFEIAARLNEKQAIQVPKNATFLGVTAVNGGFSGIGVKIRVLGDPEEVEMRMLHILKNGDTIDVPVTYLGALEHKHMDDMFAFIENAN